MAPGAEPTAAARQTGRQHGPLLVQVGKHIAEQTGAVLQEVAALRQETNARLDELGVLGPTRPRDEWRV